MIKILIPQIKSKGKTNIRGLWLAENNKLYYDYLTEQIIDLDYNSNNTTVVEYLEYLRVKYNQIAIFFSVDNSGYVYYSKDKIEVLPNSFSVNINKNVLKAYSKKLLRDYKGLTIYRLKDSYILKVYY